MDLNEVKKPKRYTTQEVADFLGMSYMKVYRLVKSGKMKATNIAPEGSKKSIFLFKAEDVQAYYDHLPDSTPRIKILDQ